MNDYLEILLTLTQNTVFQAGLYVIGSLIAAKLVDWIITSGLSRMANRTASTIDDRIIQILHRPIYYSILFMGLGISIQLFQLPEIITFVLIGLFKSTAIFIWSIALFQSFMHFINWYSRHKTFGESIVQPHTLPLFDNVGKVVIFLVAVYFMLISWNINVTGLLASTTVLAAILGFAAKDTVANLFAGFFIMADTPYKPGDYINLDGGERGYVKHIGLRSTRIMTRDDIEITLPNSLIANSKIINESGGPKENERVRITISVAYGSDVDQVRSVLEKIAINSDNVCQSPIPRVRFRTFGDSGLTFQLLFWIEKPEDRGRITDELNTAIYKEFAIEEIVIPYPQRTIHIKSSDLPN
ncbi:MAG: mechanosensitive ion channel family protein [Candidatus Marinimicrobia bacterium]|nr:mechanosensitive ion channel family protein [Candidatus Neomarinimicrobiota bacterium]